MTDVHYSPLVAANRAGTRWMAPTFSCPQLVTSVSCSSCHGPHFEVFLIMHTAESLDCCNCWQNYCTCHVALTQALALTRSLQTLSCSDQKSSDTKGSEGKLRLHGFTRKKKDRLIHKSRLYRTSYILQIRGMKIYCHCTNTPENKNTPGNIRTFIFSSQTHPKVIRPKL
jgi:hypothetical protein